MSNLLYKENFSQLENSQIFFPSSIFTFNNLSIHFTLDKNINGNYNIEIVTEQIVDEGINLKRRYGIAIGSDNIIAVQWA